MGDTDRSSSGQWEFGTVQREFTTVEWELGIAQWDCVTDPTRDPGRTQLLQSKQSQDPGSPPDKIS